MDFYIIAGLVLVAALAILATGYWLRSRQTVIERQQLRAQRLVLDSEWKAMAGAQQLGHLLFWSQQQMDKEERTHRFTVDGAAQSRGW